MAIVLFFSCKESEKKIEISVVFALPELNIVCENEKLLLEDTTRNYELSFDTIKSARFYWETLKQYFINTNGLKYPYLEIDFKRSSEKGTVKIPLAEKSDLYYPRRFSQWFYSNEINAKRLEWYYNLLSCSDDTTYRKNKSEVSLLFDRDSIIDIKSQLQTLQMFTLNISE